VVVCINKMDMVKYEQSVFERISNDFQALNEKAGFSGQKIKFIPVAAKDGDNVVFTSLRMPWYKGDTLLEYLENISVVHADEDLPSRFAVQYVIRPHTDAFHDFRGYAGKLESGVLNKGDKVTVLPSERTSKINSIYFYDGEKQACGAKQSVVITLEDDVDVSRGNMIVRTSEVGEPRGQFQAKLCWMEASPAATGKNYLLQHGINHTKARIVSVDTVLDIHRLEPDTDNKTLKLNDIGEVSIKLAKPIFADLYSQNPRNGAFILIDEGTNNTVAVGFIQA
jgi:sulfate adenylyltransferase subunit 1